MYAWGTAVLEELVLTGEERGKANAVVLSLGRTLGLPGKSEKETVMPGSRGL